MTAFAVFVIRKCLAVLPGRKKKSSRNDRIAEVAVGRGYTVCRRPLIGFSPGRVLLGILHGRVPLGAPNSDPISDKKKVIIHTRFQTWPLRNNVIII